MSSLVLETDETETARGVCAVCAVCHIQCATFGQDYLLSLSPNNFSPNEILSPT